MTSKLTSKQLKEKALNKKTAALPVAPAKEDSVVDYASEAIQCYVDQLYDFALEFAEEGYLKVEYDCKVLELKVIEEVAKHFKQQHNTFFVLIHSGKKTITVDWSNSHES